MSNATQKNENNNLKLPVFPENIPADLKSIPAWMNWRLENDTKAPYRACDGGFKASSTNPQTWDSFDRAYRYYDDRPVVAGIGLSLFNAKTIDGLDLVGIDFDGAKSNDGVPTVFEWTIAEEFNSYTERTPSGGLRVWIKVDLARCGDTSCFAKKQDGMEWYGSGEGRYFTVTGNRVGHLPATIEFRQEDFEYFLATYMVKEVAASSSMVSVATPANVEIAERLRQLEVYLNACRGATAGNNASGYAFVVAMTAVWGFKLHENIDLVRSAMCQWGQRSDQKSANGAWYPWSEAEINHKIDSALQSTYSGSIGDRLHQVDLLDLPEGYVLEELSPPTKSFDTKNFSDDVIVDPCFDADTKKETPKAPASSYKFAPVSAAQLAEMQFSIEWLVSGVLVAGQPAIVGAPKKTLKTCLMTDLAISLSSGTAFLGKFKVPRKIRTVFISGESGEFTIKETCLRIANSKGFPFSQCDCHFDFRLPKLSVEEEVKELSEGLRKLGAKVAIIDPLYLCLLSGGDKRAENLYDMGPLLQQISNACLSVGCTPILVHHAKKNMAIPYQPLELEDLSYSGVQEFARQWILLSRREKYNPTLGDHKLYMTYGGSVGHGGLKGIDVCEGVINEDFTGRKWEVEVVTLDEIKEVKEAAKASKKELAEKELEEELIECLPSTKNKLKAELGWGQEKVMRIIHRLINDGRVEPITEVINRPNGSKIVAETYHLTNPSGEPVQPEGLKSDGFIE